MRARYYNLEIRRFVSEDSYEGSITNPLSLNLYTYCENDPINKIDPSGHSALVGALPLGGGCALADGPLPFGDIIGGVIIVGAGIYDGYQVYKAKQSGKVQQRSGPIGKEGIKKQGREVKEKKRSNDNWKSRSNKNPDRPMKKHIPGRDHK